MKKKVAVIGSGISGISSAWFLAQGHDVTLFEKNDYLGGHTHTVDVPFIEQGVHQAVDTGFIVYNEPNYPLLTKMLHYLDIKTEDTDMSFGVSINQGKLEYAGSNLNTLFAQRRNLFSADHWALIFEILRFNKQAKSDLNTGLDSITLSQMRLGDYLEQHGFSDALQRHYLLPMAAAIWSCPTELMKQFPVISFLRFFNNHGLLNVNDRPQWKTVTNGSRSYLEAILSKMSFKVIQSEVIAVEILAEGVRLQDTNQYWHVFDEVVFACHADQARKLLPGEDFALLDAFKYQPNDTWLHSDESLMPKNKLTWSSWNYLSDQQGTEPFVSVTYWMNHLQNFKTPKPVFVTLNPPHPPADEHVWMRMSYDHPVFDEAAMAAQTQLRKLQGRGHCWFTGSYFGYGFHEDGLRSAAELTKLWGLALPWESKQNSHEDLTDKMPPPSQWAITVTTLNRSKNMANNIDYTQGLYVGEVMHQRNAPLFYKFKYGVFSVKVDIDRIEATARKLRWLSLNGFNLLSLYTRDHGSRDGRPWRVWFDEFMLTYGLKQPAKRVELLCLPRVLGYSFNPLSMWFAYDSEERLIAVIAEVSNTFGQWHHYVLCNQGNPLDSVNIAHNSASLVTQADKVFHVSPFINMAQRYHFRFKAPRKHYQMHIKEWAMPTDASITATGSETENLSAPSAPTTDNPVLPLLIATQSGIHQPLNNSNLLKQFLKLPWQSLKVIAMIHWWALKIWFKGGKFHRTPAALSDIDYSHSEMQFKQS